MHPVSLYSPQNFKELENPAQSPQNSNCAFSIRIKANAKKPQLPWKKDQKRSSFRYPQRHGTQRRRYSRRPDRGRRDRTPRKAGSHRRHGHRGFQALVSATNNFENKLGQGGFSPVFKVRSFSYTRTETYWTSWLIPVFVIVNIVVFVVLMYVNDCPKHNRSRTYGKCVASLEKLGALQWQKIVHGNQGWRLVTANWLHVGLIHPVANMLSLVLIGIRLEQKFGFLRVGLIYLLSGFVGSILSSLFIQNNISVGAGNMLAFNYHCSFCARNMLCSRSPKSKNTCFI
ncbi:hypothetical protein LXL04_024385 [Taraxacum kok-saghyz]